MKKALIFLQCIILAMTALIPAASAEDDNLIVVLQVGSNKMRVGDKVVSVDSDNPAVVPFVENDRTLVPVSRIVEAFGGDSYWYPEREVGGYTYNMAVFALDIFAVGCVIDTKLITALEGIYDEEPESSSYEMDVNSIIYNDRTYVPIRDVLENLGLHVEYRADDKLIIVSDDSLSNSEINAVEAPEPVKIIPDAIVEATTIDGHTYNTEVGDAITFFHSRRPIGDYYAYTWFVIEGADLVTLDPDGPTCMLYAKAPGTVKLAANLDETISYGWSFDHRSYEYTLTIEIAPDSGNSESSIKNWQICPSCGGSGSIAPGGNEFTCPTCMGSGSILR